MYLVRDVFKTKPGKAKDLVKMFKQAIPHFEGNDGIKSTKVLTDIVTGYWTVVVQSEVEDIGAFMKGLRNPSGSDELKEIMKGYIDLVDSGYREIFLVE
jgi:heme-degrading monooxygenase HmoA